MSELNQQDQRELAWYRDLFGRAALAPETLSSLPAGQTWAIIPAVLPEGCYLRSNKAGRVEPGRLNFTIRRHKRGTEVA